MTVRFSRAIFAGLAFACAIPQFASAQLLYSEAFDDSSADVKINQEPDTFATFVDYSNMTVGTSNFSIPEAPRSVAGGQATRGLLMQANLTAGAPAGINVLAGATPATFSGDFRMSYDVYLSVPNDVTAPYPTSGSTEQLLWGVGNDDAAPIESRHTRLAGAVGTYGWLAGENGYSFEDASIWENGANLAQLGDTQLGQDAPFNAAFSMPATPNAPNNAPANSWVAVDIEVLGGNVSVKFNGVEFFNEASASTNGFAMLGYEDPFGSIASYDPLAPNANPNFPNPFPVEDHMWGLVDNFTVTQIPEPGSLGLIVLGLGLTVWSRRRRSRARS